MVNGSFAFDFGGDFYTVFLEPLPDWLQLFTFLFVLTVFLALVATFIWYFYKSISQRNLLDLNLYKYNLREHHLAQKTFAVVFYFLEYIIIMPFLILVWFSSLVIVLLVIAESASVPQILVLTTILVSAIRLLAYFKQDLAQDVAKLFPFITLSVFLLTPGSLRIFDIFTRTIDDFLSLTGEIVYFMVFVLVLEVLLRFSHTLFEFVQSEHFNRNMSKSGSSIQGL